MNFCEEGIIARENEMNFLAATREQTDLEKLIADSIEKRERKLAETMAAQTAEERRYAALFRATVASVIERVTPNIPPALQPYIVYKGGPGPRDMLDARTWRPRMLDIDAPGLCPIKVQIDEFWTADGIEGSRLRVVHLRVDGDITTFGPDEWQDAIAIAALLHQARVEAEAELT